MGAPVVIAKPPRRLKAPGAQGPFVTITGGDIVMVAVVLVVVMATTPTVIIGSW
jgi:hypothetical protein